MGGGGVASGRFRNETGLHGLRYVPPSSGCGLFVQAPIRSHLSFERSSARSGEAV